MIKQRNPRGDCSVSIKKRGVSTRRIDYESVQTLSLKGTYSKKEKREGADENSINTPTIKEVNTKN
jgi:hypothetical protein